MVDPSCAVTTTVMVFVPTARLIGLLGWPLVAVVPLTVTVALAWFTVGVTCTLVTALPALAVYAAVAPAKVGTNVTEDGAMLRPFSVASLLSTCTPTVKLPTRLVA